MVEKWTFDIYRLGKRVHEESECHAVRKDKKLGMEPAFRSLIFQAVEITYYNLKGKFNTGSPKSLTAAVFSCFDLNVVTNRHEEERLVGCFIHDF